MKIAYRDKVLLTIMVVIITAFLAYIIGIKPKMEAIETSKSTQETAQTELDKVNSEVKRLTRVKKEIADYEVKSSTASNTFLKHTPNFNVDRFIQKMLNDHDLIFTAFQISDPDVIDLTGYSYSPKSLVYPLGGTFNVGDPDGSAKKEATVKTETKNSASGSTKTSSSDKNSDKDETKMGLTSLPSVTIEMDLVGTNGNLEDFFNDLCKKQQMSVVLNEYKEVVVGDKVQTKVKMTVYFLQPVDIKAKN